VSLFVEAQAVPPFGANAYLVGDPESKKAILIDPGGPVDALLAALEREKLTPVAILATHAHIDHVAGVAEAKARLGVPFWLQSDDRRWLEGLDMQAAMFGFGRVEIPTVERWLEDRDAFRLGSLEGRVIHTPGHSPGSCCVFFEEAKALFSGDTLFVNAVGRTDLPGGSARQLVASIRERLFPLGDGVRLYPGHGPPGLLGDERSGNPFVSESAP
jgi:glyoxylase-like metal-dependent hydrolase (beta-lactamase superfamily II)